MKYAVDFDRTLAYYESGWFKEKGSYYLGDPIPLMVDFVKNLLKEGHEVVIYTARLSDLPPVPLGCPYKKEEYMYLIIQDWTEKHIGQRLEVTNIKTWDIDVFIDDKALTCIPNTGEVITMEKLNQLLDLEKRVNAVFDYSKDMNIRWELGIKECSRPTDFIVDVLSEMSWAIKFESGF